MMVLTGCVAPVASTDADGNADATPQTTEAAPPSPTGFGTVPYSDAGVGQVTSGDAGAAADDGRANAPDADMSAAGDVAMAFDAGVPDARVEPVPDAARVADSGIVPDPTGGGGIALPFDAGSEDVRPEPLLDGDSVSDGAPDAEPKHVAPLPVDDAAPDVVVGTPDGGVEADIGNGGYGSPGGVAPPSFDSGPSEDGDPDGA